MLVQEDEPQMATNPKVVAVDETAGSGKGRTRSPAYPFINLEAAIKRAQEFYDHELRNAASLKIAVKHWGYQEKSSGGLQTTAALISFGLMEDEGSGDKRKLKLTPKAIRMLLDKRPDSSDRAQAIKEFALNPKLHRDLWDKWGNSLPSEDQVRYTLTAEWEPPFNEKTVDAFIKEYKDTISFAKLSESDKFTSEGESNGGHRDGKYVPKVGDFVQWESAGILQFPQPKVVTGISSDGAFAFVEGSPTGLPIYELTKEEGASVPLHFSYKLPDPPSKTNVQEDVFSIAEGRVVIQWPSPLSAESIQDLKDWLKIVERKIARSTQSSEAQTK
jgi:hypothetical protein